MQVNKQIIIMLVLASLLFSALGAAFYFYKKNQQAIKSKNELVTVYIAKEDLKRNTLIQESDLAQTKIAKQYILNKPLLKNEIVGKYTREKIYKNEVFLKQKLNTKIQKDRAKILDFTKGSYNMGFKLFENPNYALVQGDLMNIISVYPKGLPDRKGKYEDFEVQYIAQNIKVLGFIRDGHTESLTIVKKKVKKVVKKKVIDEIIDVKADELILDIDPMVLIGLIKDYNKGNQLWMVKTKESILIDSLEKMSKDDQIKQMAELDATVDNKIIVGDKKVVVSKNGVIQKTVKTTPVKPKVYKYKWYSPKATTIKRSAVIDYSTSGEKDDEGSRKVKSVDIVIDSAKECKKIKDKLVVGVTNSFYIRDEATTKSKVKKLLVKNTVIPYKEDLKYWYLLCDGMYVSKNVVKPITYKDAVKRIGR